MASSGVVTHRTNRNEIINGALRLCGGVDPENASGATTTQISNAAEALNLFVKQLETQGLHLWERKYAVIFPQKGQSVYVLGSPGPAGDHATLATPLGEGGFVKTTLAAAASSGATTIVVTSASSGFSVGVAVVSITTAYYIGIEQDDGTVHWTTVNGAPSGTTVTLTSALTDNAADGNTVYCYSTKLIRPLRIMDAWIRQSDAADAGSDSPIGIIPLATYNGLGNKTQTGTPSQVAYSPQVNAGHLYVYPAPDDVSEQLYIEFERPIDDFAASGDDYDMPQEWGNALKFNLALLIAPEYEVSDGKFKQIQYLAQMSLGMVTGWDQDTTSIFFQPGM